MKLTYKGAPIRMYDHKLGDWVYEFNANNFPIRCDVDIFMQDGFIFHTKTNQFYWVGLARGEFDLPELDICDITPDIEIFESNH